jgi:hypothetical protein
MGGFSPNSQKGGLGGIWGFSSSLQTLHYPLCNHFHHGIYFPQYLQIIKPQYSQSLRH